MHSMQCTHDVVNTSVVMVATVRQTPARTRVQCSTGIRYFLSFVNYSYLMYLFRLKHKSSDMAQSNHIFTMFVLASFQGIYCRQSLWMFLRDSSIQMFTRLCETLTDR